MIFTPLIIFQPSPENYLNYFPSEHTFHCSLSYCLTICFSEVCLVPAAKTLSLLYFGFCLKFIARRWIYLMSSCFFDFCYRNRWQHIESFVICIFLISFAYFIQLIVQHLASKPQFFSVYHSLIVNSSILYGYHQGSSLFSSNLTIILDIESIFILDVLIFAIYSRSPYFGHWIT